jgi:hypothetical protein
MEGETESEQSGKRETMNGSFSITTKLSNEFFLQLPISVGEKKQNERMFQKATIKVKKFIFFLSKLPFNVIYEKMRIPNSFLALPHTTQFSFLFSTTESENKWNLAERYECDTTFHIRIYFS